MNSNSNSDLCFPAAPAPSPVRSLIILLLVLFFVEMVLMFSFPFLLPGKDSTLTNVMDATLLTILCAPFLYRLIFRPYKRMALALGSVTENVLGGVVDGVVLFDEENIIRSFNVAAEKIFGYRAGEVIGTNLHLLVENGCLPKAEVGLSFADKGSADHNRERVGRRRDGREIPLDISVSRVKVGDEWIYLAIVRDLTEVKRVEAEYQAIIRTAMDGFWINDERGKFIDINDTYCRMSGYSREELLNMEIRDVEAAMTDEEIHVRMQDIRRPGRTPFETRHRRKDGSTFDVEISANYLPSADGRFFAFLRDITCRNRMLENLAGSEEKYRTLADNVTVGVTLLSPRMEVLSANRQSHRWYPDLDETTRPLCYQSFNNPPRESTCPGCPTILTLADGEIHEAIVQNNWLGEARHFRIVSSPFKDEAGAITGVIESVEEVTSLKRSESELREALSRLTATLEATADGILVVDLNGRIVSYNQKFVQMLHVPVPILETRDYFLIIDNLHGQLKNHQSFVPAVQEDVERDIHDLLEFKDGRIIERFCRPQRIGDIIVGRVSSFRDITDERKMEGQLRHAQKMEAIGTLTGKVAHDFNNMLTAIIGYCHLSQMQLDRDAPLMQNIKQIMTAAERAAGLTQSLLEYSHKTPSNPQAMELNKVVRQVGGFLTRLIGEDIELITTLNERPLAIVADTGQIEQVLMNLATNARDAMSGKGRLSISTAATEIDKEFIESHGFGNAGAFALLSVADTGAGMDDRTCEKIFEPFFTTKSAGNGTGLGLSIVYGIVKQNGGYITVESAKGRGTIFRIYFPLTSGNTVERKEETQLKAQGGTETILVAEDNSEVKALLVDVLQGYGYRVVTALDGLDCVETFEKNRDTIDLILMDVMMPKKNGKEAYGEIEKLKPGMKVIFISGYTADILNGDDIAEGLNLLAKPLSPNRLLTKVREILDNN
ncbi:PAS domain S-box protein [Geotalea sp. SG265]|uniref:PAS domain S-box protein n=1 Tax=Geotalea sp. SG265 TaxID=2922867 RepID=UPI001FAF2FDD|nr:PAS domain S-box protein [Geotalea sp. SG265]